MKRYCFILFPPLLLLLFSCSDGNSFSWSNEPESGETPYLEITEHSLRFSSNFNNQQIRISTNRQFKVDVYYNTDNPTGWITISPSSGNGETVINISVDENTTLESRQALIHVGYKNNSNAIGWIADSINVYQEPASYITPSKNEIDFSAEGGRATIDLISNVNYTYSTSANWLKLTSSTDHKKLTITATENNSVERRTASVILSYGETKNTITVTQEAGITLLPGGGVDINGIITYGIRNSIKKRTIYFSMIKVEGGTFTMGATPEQGSEANDDEKPAHQVTLSPYYIGETEVTQGFWYALMGQSPTSDGSKWSTSYGIGESYPAYYISYWDCQTFLTKLNQLTGQKFRLPTEAEWEFAARGGNASKGYKYSGGNIVGDIAWYTDNSSTGTLEVKTKKANELGLNDMSGNVWEWCSDYYDSSYYSSSPSTNPTGPTTGSFRVIRGGGWSSTADRCRVASHNGYQPSDRSYSLGFRLAL